MPISEDIHSNDELFKQAYNNLEEAPSPDVWEKLNAKLNQKDAAYYRDKFVWWKRAAVILFVLLASVISYELFTMESDHSSKEAQQQINYKITDSAVNNQNLPLAKSDVEGHEISKKSIDKDVIKTNSDAALNKSRNTVPGQRLKLNNTKQGLLKPGNVIDESFVPSTYNLNKTIHFNNQQVKPDTQNKNNVAQLNQIEKTAKASSQTPGVHLSFNDFIRSNIAGINVTATNNKTGIVGNSLKEPVTNIVLHNSKKEKIILLHKHSWSFSPFASADFGGRRIDNDKDHERNEPNDPDESNNISHREQHEFSYSIGVLGRYNFNQSFAIKTGFVYSNMAIGIQPQTLHTSMNNGYKYVTSSGYTYLTKVFGQTPTSGDSVLAEHAENHVSYLSVPLVFGYSVRPFAKLSVRPGLGITTHILLVSKVETELKRDDDREHISIKSFEGQRPLYFSLTADAEINYKLNNKVGLMLIPTFNYALNSITRKNDVNTYPYIAGVGAGITWNISD